MNTALKKIVIFLLGALVGGMAIHLFLINGHNHDHHPIADPYDTKYHVHADFHIVINGERLDLSRDEFQTTSEQELHPDLHLHDNIGEVLHIHAENKTFVEFLQSLGMDLNMECITTTSRETFCDGERDVLRAFGFRTDQADNKLEGGRSTRIT